MSKLLIATYNKGKLHEYRSLLQGIPFQLVSPSEEGIVLDVQETGKTFAENAIIKAKAFAAESGLLTLADDSGLEVDALGGEPGVMSARYAGEGASDMQRINYLLSRLNDIPRDKRSARFRCVIAIATPDSKVQLCSGKCEGIIAFEPKGEHGFGYDPVFYFPEFDKTMAELPLDLKNQISHRGRAAKEVRKILISLTGVS